MANADTPFGFRPVMMLDGSPYNGHTLRCVFASGDSTATFIGDAVTLAGSSVGGVPTVQQAAKTDTFFGVVTSFEPDRTDLSSVYRLASTERYCHVVPALDVIFEIQADEDIEAGDVGNTADIIVGSGNTTYGISGMELDSSDIGSNANLQILGIVNREDNEAGSNNTKVLVRINESQLRGTGTGA